MAAIAGDELARHKWQQRRRVDPAARRIKGRVETPQQYGLDVVNDQSWRAGDRAQKKRGR